MVVDCNTFFQLFEHYALYDIKNQQPQLLFVPTRMKLRQRAPVCGPRGLCVADTCLPSHPSAPAVPQVNLVSEHIWCDDFLVRSFYLKNLQTNETRTVTQFHFLSWYDQGVPSSTRSLLDFRR